MYAHTQHINCSGSGLQIKTNTCTCTFDTLFCQFLELPLQVSLNNSLSRSSVCSLSCMLPPLLQPAGQRLPCWTLASQVMPKLHLTHWCPLLCNDWPPQFCFLSRTNLGPLGIHTQAGFGKGKIYVETMMKINPCIFMQWMKNETLATYEKNVNFLLWLLFCCRSMCDRQSGLSFGFF